MCLAGTQFKHYRNKKARHGTELFRGRALATHNDMAALRTTSLTEVSDRS
jgi:hypothetical protein